jgi:hypothetical protein
MKKVILLSVLAILIVGGASAQVPIYQQSAKKSNYLPKDTPAAVQEQQGINGLTVVNPVGDFLDIRAAQEANITKVEIFNTAGSLQLSESVQGNQLLLSVQFLNSGVYVLRISNEVSVHTTMIFKS